jgi:undecaprenyl-diphosphatase
VAVLAYFWKDLAAFLKAALHPADSQLSLERKTIWNLIIATIPGAIAGLLLEHKAENAFRSPFLIAVALIAMGVLLLIADLTGKGRKSMADLSWRMAFLIGISQGLALIPGVSRSGATITLALFMGLERSEAARFSFLMSIPIIAGAGMLKLKEILLAPDQTVLIVGLASAAISGFLAIWVLMHYVQRNRYTPFVLYRWALGLFVLLNLAHFQ